MEKCRLNSTVQLTEKQKTNNSWNNNNNYYYYFFFNFKQSLIRGF